MRLDLIHFQSIKKIAHEVYKINILKSKMIELVKQNKENPFVGV